MNYQKRDDISSESQKIGQNHYTVRQYNRRLVLKEIACNGPISRAELSEKMGLTKAALGNIVSELIEKNLIEENPASPHQDIYAQSNIGRPPIMLSVSSKAPVICGILLKRRFFTICISDLSGNIKYSETQVLPSDIDSSALVSSLLSSFGKLSEKVAEPLMAVGIACIGPVDTVLGEILDPPNFHGISHLKICDILSQQIGLPCFLISDSSAGALAEKLYGSAKELANFIYLHIMDGIGSGFILNSHLYDGIRGLAGEIGHTTINASGPRCSCGNFGCLELYANKERLKSTIKSLEKAYHRQCTFLSENDDFELSDVINAAGSESPFAIIALQEFCGYLSSGAVNLVKLLNIDNIIVGYDGAENLPLLEDMLHEMISERIPSVMNSLSVRRSSFYGNAPLVGSVALIAAKVFDGEIPIL